MADADADPAADELPVLPGRLQRLADELADEGIPALEGAPHRVAALVELAYALRPQDHEGRVPSYGALLLPSADDGSVDMRAADVTVDLIDVRELDVQFARRFADGVTSFVVRSSEAIDQLACFGRNMADEIDLVGLQSAVGGIVIQRHPGGQVRVFGPAGVMRWNGTRWLHDAPVDAWIVRLAALVPDVAVDQLRPLLQFAVHELGGRRIGATLVWRTSGREASGARHEPLVHNAPTLRLGNLGEEGALAQALALTDGAAMFDAATLIALGIRLAPSAAAEKAVPAMRGMRHTSALRYSFDDPEAIVIVVSESGPVTLMHAGRAITSVDPGEERIG